MTNINQALFKVTGATQSRILGDHLGDIINAKGFGAKGDGTTDDTTALQNAINAAFGSIASPLANQFLQKALFIPSGKYIITAPLYMTGVTGGWLCGEGGGTTQIFYNGTGNEGNTLDSTNPTWTPALMFDGVGYSVIENISFSTPSGHSSNTNTIGIYVYQSGTRGYTGTCMFKDCSFANFYQGILADSNGNGNCDNCQVVLCQFNNCGLAGVRLADANAVNWQVYGGGAQSCAKQSTFATGTTGNSGAAYSVASGSLTVISGVSCSGNTDSSSRAGWDIVNSGSQGMSVLGGRFESINCIGGSGSSIFVSGLVYGGGDSTSCCFFDGSNSGILVSSALVFGPNNLNAGGTNRIATLGNTGIFLSTGMTIQNSNLCGFSGASSAKISLKAPIWGQAGSPSDTTLFGSFTGTVLDYEFLVNVGVGSLPAANAKYNGLRLFVTDANSTTFASTAASGGGNRVPVYCDGNTPAWRIG
jgi:hypothetical protein